MIDVTVVIPCRAGSTRVKNKNFRPFSNTSLLEIKIKQALKLNLPLVINSDSAIAERVAIEHNIGFVKRPEYYASSNCNNSDYYEYLANSVETGYIMVLQPTAPLLKDVTLLNCIKTFSDNVERYDSLVTAQFSKKHAWFNNKPINYDLGNTPNSQDLSPIVLPTFNVMIAKVDSLLKTRNIITSKCLFYEISDDEAIEIDNQLDFDMAEFLYNRFKNENK